MSQTVWLARGARLDPTSVRLECLVPRGSSRARLVPDRVRRPRACGPRAPSAVLDGLLQRHRCAAGLVVVRPGYPRSFSMLYWLAEPEHVALFFAVTALAVVAFTVGWRTRVFQVVAAICVWSIHARNPLIQIGRRRGDESSVVVDPLPAAGRSLQHRFPPARQKAGAVVGGANLLARRDRDSSPDLGDLLLQRGTQGWRGLARRHSGGVGPRAGQVRDVDRSLGTRRGSSGSLQVRRLDVARDRVGGTSPSAEPLPAHLVPTRSSAGTRFVPYRNFHAHGCGSPFAGHDRVVPAAAVLCGHGWARAGTPDPERQQRPSSGRAADGIDPRSTRGVCRGLRCLPGQSPTMRSIPAAGWGSTRTSRCRRGRARS